MNFKQIKKDITPMYEGPHRNYHTMEHIDHMLQLFNHNNLAIYNHDIVHLAILFHDVIYNPHKTDNEIESVSFFNDYIREQQDILKLSEHALEMLWGWVSVFILATIHHHTPDKQSMPASLVSDLEHFLDMDMAILGEDKTTFDKYEDNIRREYFFVPIDVYKTERAKILQSFLNNEFIYNAPVFRKKYEASARKNIKGLITTLGK